MSASHALSANLVHIPDFSGFTHTIETKFTYFEGSDAGARTTFGLSVSNLMVCINNFETTLGAYPDKDNASLNQLLNVIKEQIKKIEELAHQLKTKTTSYENLDEMAKGVHKTGHIPIMLTHINAASVYKRATRSISQIDLEEFLKKSLPGTKSQILEYLVKQDAMRFVAELISLIRSQQIKLNSTHPTFMIANKIIADLNTLVIIPNQQSMPKEYEQFDLYSTFAHNVLKFLAKMPFTEKFKTFYDQCEQRIKEPSDNSTYYAQKTLVDFLYKELQSFCIGWSISPKSQTKLVITEDNKINLQNILPLVAYLNSPNNPFARNGLFGDLVTNPIHQAALKSYQAHETQQKPYCYYDLKVPRILLNDAKQFTDEQIQQLIFGKELKKESTHSYGFFGKLASFISSSLSEGANVAPTTKTQTETKQALLTLPVPSQFLLMPPEPEKGITHKPPVYK